MAQVAGIEYQVFKHQDYGTLMQKCVASGCRPINFKDIMDGVVEAQRSGDSDTVKLLLDSYTGLSDALVRRGPRAKVVLNSEKLKSLEGPVHWNGIELTDDDYQTIEGPELQGGEFARPFGVGSFDDLPRIWHLLARGDDVKLREFFEIISKNAQASPYPDGRRAGAVYTSPNTTLAGQNMTPLMKALQFYGSGKYSYSLVDSVFGGNNVVLLGIPVQSETLDDRVLAAKSII